MSKETKALPEAIRTVVGQYGKNIVNDVRLANVMSDIVDLEDTAAVKTILRDVLSMGYGEKIFAIVPEKEDVYLKVKAFAKDISNNHGYKDVFVQYVLYSIAFGIGLITKEPHIKTITSPKERLTLNSQYNKRESDVDPLELVPKKTIPFWSVAIMAVVLLVVAVYGFMYMASSTDREQFNQRIYTGDSFMHDGDYINAVESYKKAFNGYNAMNSNGYKEDAFKSMDALNQNLLEEGKNNNKTLLDASKVIRSELSLNLGAKEKEKLQGELKELEAIVTDKVINGHQLLITNISANNGKLDERGKILLNELLALSPDDYWLNFIKKNSYE